MEKERKSDYINMNEISRFIVDKKSTLEDAMKVIDRNASGFAVVCDGKKLCGIVTDGDIRRYLLAGGSLKENICSAANQKPYYVDDHMRHMAKPIIRNKALTAIPVIDEKHELIDIISDHVSLKGGKKEMLGIPLVVMAGGKGTRLQPYTDILPKPLIPVDGITITEQIMNRFSEYGCNDVYMIVNYMKDFIKAYFREKDITQTVHFVEEEQFLGTGGGLAYIKGIIRDTFFVSNCDVLIDCDYAKMLAWHRENKNIFTMVCAKKNLVIPYGTIEIGKEQQILSMKEKPEVAYYVNTGIYIVEPEFLCLIPDGKPVHMTQLIELAIKNEKKVGTYVIDENRWMDMGQMEELEQMKEKLEQF